MAACVAAARTATVPISVHLDHASQMSDIERAVHAGLHSVLADFSHETLEINQRQTRIATALAHRHIVEVSTCDVAEAELCRKRTMLVYTNTNRCHTQLRQHGDTLYSREPTSVYRYFVETEYRTLKLRMNHADTLKQSPHGKLVWEDNAVSPVWLRGNAQV